MADSSTPASPRTAGAPQDAAAGTSPDAASSATGRARLSLAGLKIDRSAAAPRKRWRRWPWVLGLALVGVAAALFIPRKATVQVSTVQAAWPSAQYSQLAASGYVVAQRRAAVASKATGRLVELTVREGSVVKKGDLLARVDASDVAANLGVAEAGALQAEAAIRQASAGLEQARVQQANAEADFARTQGLAAQGFVSPQALDAADTRARAARAATATAQAGVATAQAALNQARAQVKVQQVSRDSTDIRAPFDGVVLVKNANVGDLITPFSNASGTSAAVVTLADMGTLEVEADVSESSVSKVKLDQPVEITLDAIPGLRFRGSVARVVPTVDRSKATVMTKVRFEQLDARILPEMSAKVSFLSQRTADGEMQSVLAVNPATVVERNGAKVVLRVGSGEAVEAVPVAPGRKLGDVLEVKAASGAELKAGDRLVLAPPPSLGVGTVVSITAAGAK